MRSLSNCEIFIVQLNRDDFITDSRIKKAPTYKMKMSRLEMGAGLSRLSLHTEGHTQNLCEGTDSAYQI